MATQSLQRPPIPRCSSCLAWPPKPERATWPRLCQECRARIRAEWQADLAAILDPAWPATQAAGIRAARQAVAR